MGLIILCWLTRMAFSVTHREYLEKRLGLLLADELAVMAVQHRRRPVAHLLHGLFSFLHLLTQSPARLLAVPRIPMRPHALGRWAQSYDGQQKAPERGFRGVSRTGLEFYSL